MEVMVSGAEAVVLAQAASRARRVRPWRRLRAIQLLGSGEPPQAVAGVLGCRLASIYTWAAAWRADGLAGVQEPSRPGTARSLDEPAERLVEERLASDPHAQGDHATGWTVPMRSAELATAGYVVSQRTIRRTRTRLGWRWQRPTDVRGRPAAEYEANKGQVSPE